MLDTIMGYDAANGGVLAVVTPTSNLTFKDNGKIVGYFYDGISAEEVTLTVPTDDDWPAAGVSLPATSDGTAVGAGMPWRPLQFQLPVKKDKAVVMTATSGNNPVWGGLLVDYPSKGEPFGLRDPLQPATAYLWTRTTVAGGTNCAAGTTVQGATGLTAWGDYEWQPVAVEAAAARTTTVFVGFRKFGGPNFIPFFPIGLTDVANDMRGYGIPKGVGQTYTGNDTMELFLGSDTAEQPTANITFARVR